MIVVSFDPISGELLLDLEDGNPPSLLARTPQVFVKFYHAEASLGAELSSEAVHLLYEAPEEEPLIMMIVPAGPGEWRLDFYPRT